MSYAIGCCLVTWKTTAGWKAFVDAVSNNIADSKTKFFYKGLAAFRASLMQGAGRKLPYVA